MKILHLVNTLSAGGAELHLLSLCWHLKRQGVETVIASLKEHVSGSRSLRFDFEEEGIHVISFGANSRFDARCLGKLIRLLKEEQPDILHTHLPRADFAGALAHLFCPRTPWVCSIHDIYSRSWSGRWTLSLFNRVWRRADTLIAISYAVRDWLVRERHIPSQKVTVIHYGIAPEQFAQPTTNWRNASNLDGRAVIGTIGRLEPRKGHEILIRSMRDILQQVPHTALLVAGHDPWGYGRTLQWLITELELGEQVQLVGFQNDIPSFLHALDVFTLASRSEGFGQVVIEAMAAGKPVVAPRIPTLTEIVIDGETGLLVEPENPKAFADAISYLLKHPKEARCMGRSGQERLHSHFSAERMARQTLSVYNELLGRRG